MTSLERLKKACDLLGQRKAANEIGYSGTTVNQVLNGIYPKPDPVLMKVDIVFSFLNSDETLCPTLGAIHNQTCERYREWAKAEKVHPDRLYRDVKDKCSNCTIGGKR